jgi:hypothetical protein
MAIIDTTDLTNGATVSKKLSDQLQRLRDNDTALNTLSDGKILVGNDENVSTAVDLSGEATISNAGVLTLDNASVINKVLTGYSKSNGTLASTDSILQAIQKLDGNIDIATTKAFNDKDYKESVRVATTENIGIQSELINEATIDGIEVATGDRVLLKNQTDASENGIYVVVASGVASRSEDADEDSEVTSGLTTYVSEGTNNGGKVYTLNTVDPIVLDTTELSFVQTGGSESYTAGDAIAFSGSTINVKYDDSTINLNGSNQLQIKDKGVSFAKIQDLNANTLLGSIAGGSVEEITLTSAGRALLDDADAEAQRTTLGLENVDNTSDATKKVNFNTLTRISAGVDTVLTMAQALGVGASIIATVDNLTISIPSVVAGDDGKIFYVENPVGATYGITIDSNDGYNISGASSYLLEAGQSLKMSYNHSNTTFTLMI